ncbi:5969_t:CDS:2 [Acaulospora colombiana]|uniref:5969_t:CDS:1 n=1 Tax=Acaulospora colombiana TaxID=27376 RepID=A0ACA9KMK1_9GLOM|nr:5969_t:CDS:2 [Acaulospora colombiana]
MPRPPRAVKKILSRDKNSLSKNEKKNVSSLEKENKDESNQREKSQNSIQVNFEKADKISDEKSKNKTISNEVSTNERSNELLQTKDLGHVDSLPSPLKERHLNASPINDHASQRLKRQKTNMLPTNSDGISDDSEGSEDDPFGFAKAEKKVRSYLKKKNSNHSSKGDVVDEYIKERKGLGEFEIIEITRDDNQPIVVDHLEDPQNNSQDVGIDPDADEVDDLFLVSLDEPGEPAKPRGKDKESIDDENEKNDDNSLPPSPTHEKDLTPTNIQPKNGSTVTMTNDLLYLLPRRRHAVRGNKGKKVRHEEELEVEGDHGTDPKKKGKDSKKKQAKRKLDTSYELDEVAERELRDRVRHFEEIDKYPLPVEEA